MSSLLMTTASFLVALGVLITVHEFGHFWVARKLGVKVLRFSVGFGKPIWKRRGTVDGTEYVVAALPLGGYVKMLDEREGDVAEAERGRAFNRQSLAVRTAIVAAGPVFNFLFAIFAYWGIFVVGETGTVPVIGSVETGSPAAAAGLRAGDRVEAVDGQETPTWESAAFAFLAASLEDNALSVRVQDETGRVLTREVSVPEDAVHSGDVIGKLGVRPLRPAVPAVLGDLIEGGAAKRAGLAPGDHIVAANDEPIADWGAWVTYVRGSPEQPIDVEIRRDGAVLHVELVPALIEQNGQSFGQIGAYVDIPEDLYDDYRAELRYSPGVALLAAAGKTWDMSFLMLRMLGRMLVGKASVENLSGPISIAQYAGKSASVGLAPFIKFLAVVSISLGVLNLLPIPLLDGGHLFYYMIEAVKGSPVSEAFEAIGQRVGLAILLCLMGLAFYMDIERLLG
jgi:regulator of sigma E protease